MIPDADLQRLEALAKKCTPGTWNHEDGEVTAFIESEGEVCVLFDSCYGFATKDDRYFVANANPITVLDLVGEVRRLREALQFYADESNYGSDDKSRTDGFDCFDVVLHDFSSSDTDKRRRFAGRRARAALAGTATTPEKDGEGET